MTLIINILLESRAEHCFMFDHGMTDRRRQVGVGNNNDGTAGRTGLWLVVSLMADMTLHSQSALYSNT